MRYKQGSDSHVGNPAAAGGGASMAMSTWLLGQRMLNAVPCPHQAPMQHCIIAAAFREGRDFRTSSSDNRPPRYGRSTDSALEDGSNSTGWQGKDRNSSSGWQGTDEDSSSGWQSKDRADRRRSSGQTAERSGLQERNGGRDGYSQRQERSQGEGRRDYRDTQQGGRGNNAGGRRDYKEAEQGEGRTEYRGNNAGGSRSYRDREQGGRRDNAGGGRWQSGFRSGGNRDSRYSQDRQYSPNNRRTYETTEAADVDEGGRDDWEEEDEEEMGEQRGRSWGRGREGAGHQDVRRSELRGEALYGVFPILNALQAKRRSSFHTLFVLSSLDLSARKDAASVQAVLSAAEAAGVAIQKVSRHELNLLSNDRPHQGLVLDCAPLANQPLDVIPDAASVWQPGSAPPVWLALDEVMDPQNLGAILRSAWCLGAAGLLVSAKNCAPLSPAVSKASAGALELAPVHSCKNMQRTLQDAAAKGWAVLGAAGEAGAVDSASLTITQPTILVMGNEGYGLRTNVRRACTGLVKVHMQQGFMTPTGGASTIAPGATGAGVTGGAAGAGATGGAAGAGVTGGAAGAGMPRRIQAQDGVDSLNVSVATGILLHDLLTAARRSVAAP